MQPAPYNRYSHFLPDTSFAEGKRKLGHIVHLHEMSKLMLDMLSGKASDEPFWEFQFNVDPERAYVGHVPIYMVIESRMPVALKFVTPVYCGVQVAVYPGDHKPLHVHVWIPPHSRRDGRYLYPSLEPYMGARPLSNKNREKVHRAIQRYRGKIQEHFVSHKA